MAIDLTSLGYTFEFTPLVIGGRALEYHGIRAAGADTDLVVSAPDHARLVEQYPDEIKDLYGDIGVLTGEFEIWNTICRFGYDELRPGAAEEPGYLVASLEKLIFLKALAMRKSEKNRRDLDLIVEHVLASVYGPAV